MPRYLRSYKGATTVSKTQYPNETSQALASERNPAKSIIDTDEILTESATASWVKMSLSGFRKLRRSRRGPRFIRVGGSRLIRYKKSDVEEWLSQHVSQ